MSPEQWDRLGRWVLLFIVLDVVVGLLLLATMPIWVPATL